MLFGPLDSGHSIISDSMLTAFIAIRYRAVLLYLKRLLRVWELTKAL